MKKRQKLFIQYYTDATDKETYGNATKAALKAGYSASRASSQGCNLLKKPHISQEIAIIEKNEADKYQATKEQAILEAREGFLRAKAAQDKTMIKYWYDMWVDLQAWKVQKIESIHQKKC